MSPLPSPSPLLAPVISMTFPRRETRDLFSFHFLQALQSAARERRRRETLKNNDNFMKTYINNHEDTVYFLSRSNYIKPRPLHRAERKIKIQVALWKGCPAGKQNKRNRQTFLLIQKKCGDLSEGSLKDLSHLSVLPLDVYWPRLRPTHPWFPMLKEEEEVKNYMTADVVKRKRTSKMSGRSPFAHRVRRQSCLYHYISIGGMGSALKT